jgi:hypothetical protein
MCRQSSQNKRVDDKVVKTNGMRPDGAPEADRRAGFIFHYFNSTRWSITTMPTIFRGEVVDAVLVMGIFWHRGA